MAIDLLPTLAALTEARLPVKKIDGLDIRPLMFGKAGASSPHEALFFYAGDELQAVRSGQWKLHFPHAYLTVDGEPGRDGKPAGFGRLKPKSITQSGIEGIASRHGYGVARIEESLFDLEADPGETINLATAHPDIVARLKKLAAPIRAELGDELTGTKASEARSAGRED